MCGITGVFAYNLVGKFSMINVAAATQAIASRGPDNQHLYHDDWIALGHRRLSVIDTSAHADQPMWDADGRYAIIYNGEIFNFQALRSELEAKGVTFHSRSDTEVLLNLYVQEKESCLTRLNGFFSFCIYDKADQTLFLARDRFGVKPLVYLADGDKFLFASEMKALLAYGIEKNIDFTSLQTYLHLNYIPAPRTIFTSVKKLMPGHYMKISRGSAEVKKWYTLPYYREKANQNNLPYGHAKERLKELLEESVQRRLVADVPLGTFLSGGIDSSIITALVSNHHRDLHTFSIGFKDEKFFDETHYATLVSKHLRTGHTVFSLTNDDLYQHVHSILDYIDEPFADSSAINVYILSRETRNYATVALSGDGADEMLGGYNKHEAYRRLLHMGWKERIALSLLPLWKVMPKSRHSKWNNLARQLQRFGDGAQLSSKDRYWRWAGFTNGHEMTNLLSSASKEKLQKQDFHAFRNELLQFLPEHEMINDVLYTDMSLVLANDMLTKVDLMSMANGLEVRSPFLDYEVVDFLFTLPDKYKINSNLRKSVLQDAYRDQLPDELYNRPKKGFEVPLLKWFQNEMKSLLSLIHI